MKIVVQKWINCMMTMAMISVQGEADVTDDDEDKHVPSKVFYPDHYCLEGLLPGALPVLLSGG